MIFVDSGVWIDYFNGISRPATDWLHSLLGIEPVATGDLVLVEVLQGFRHNPDYATAKRLFSSVPVFDIGGRAIAIKAADNYRRLRREGITIRKTIDVLIATYCIEHQLPLLHNNRDFEPFHRHLTLPRAMP